jgi:hypothetical protein
MRVVYHEYQRACHIHHGAAMSTVQWRSCNTCRQQRQGLQHSRTFLLPPRSCAFNALGDLPGSAGQQRCADDLHLVLLCDTVLVICSCLCCCVTLCW